MKMNYKKTLLIILVIGVGMAPASAFGQRRPQADEQRTRELLVKVDRGEVDGLTIRVKKRQGNSFVTVNPEIEFKEGDEVKVAFQSNFRGYVYIVNVTPGGKKKLLFPYEQSDGSETNNMVSVGQEYELPRGASWKFDKEVGIEVLQVYFSRDRIKVFDDAIKNTSGVVGTSAASAASELSARNDTTPKPESKGGISADNVAPVFQEGEAEGIRTRKIRLAPGKSQEKVAIPEDNGKPIKMQSGDVAVFEIRLKHI